MNKKSYLKIDWPNPILKEEEEEKDVWGVGVGAGDEGEGGKKGGERGKEGGGEQKWKLYSAQKYSFLTLSQMFLPWYSLVSEILSQRTIQAYLHH